jgi:hypothetical protein
MSATKTDQLQPECDGAHSLHRLDMRRVILDYEIRSSWWASWISNDRVQNLTAAYFAWKVRRKCRRWEQSRRDAEWFKAHILFRRKDFGLCAYWPRNAEWLATVLIMAQD